MRIWLDGSAFLVEFRDMMLNALPGTVMYEWGCITTEREIAVLGTVGWDRPPLADEMRELLGPRYDLSQKKPDYVGTFVWPECAEPLRDACPARSQIIEGVLDLIRYYLSLDPQDQQLLDAGRIVVTIGEFSCFSESVWVLVEPTEAPVWEIKFERGETCEDMSIIPKDFRLMYSWPLRFPEDEPDLWPPYNNPLPLTRADVARLRAHGVVVRLAPKPKGK
jgi:hypothetical protein